MNLIYSDELLSAGSNLNHGFKVVEITNWGARLPQNRLAVAVQIYKNRPQFFVGNMFSLASIFYREIVHFNLSFSAKLSCGFYGAETMNEIYLIHAF